MAFGGLLNDAGDGDNAEINMIPLIDVMLVLLVIFIITAPLMMHAVKVDLPVAASQPNDVKPETINLSIKADGSVYWNAVPMEQTAWRAQMDLAAAQTPQPEIHIRADGELAYKNVAQIMADAARSGLTKLGFVTLPDTAH
ncbi:MAG: biopolymer transporter ExbD [Hydrogenophilales bacterium 16-64-46]|nr:MAG: biopolymer transporter ExbD [Hydrogenophilales bacterium 12-64-13]OYZ06274.1 MAG: biopolymer transporter ExbD [Hydrogenophilales bacterium 16-64-46]OZA38827.1 MAG: biopolymer transporter ExbD [Hydrogenophilales bacterium 17-64-34]HQS99537.1 biopolymer transporter ExbD [Thiobacillus sp.]